METLTNENYHSTEMRKIYMGYSQFKDFLKCEKEALAKVNGEVEEKQTDALLFGSYVDAHFSGELEQFKTAHPEMYNSKTGELKAAFKDCETVINTYESDPMLKKYWGGEHQVIMTGEIEGVKVKIKIDSYFKDKAIVDGKVMKDLNPVWIEKVDENGYVRNVRVNFVEAYRYDLEGAIYQEIERQWNIAHGGADRKLPFFLDVVTKEEAPDKALLEIDQEDLDKALEEVKSKIKRFDDIKKGLIQPNECGKCKVCRKTKQITGIFSYHLFDPYKGNDE